jgi:hypothetical protein
VTAPVASVQPSAHLLHRGFGWVFGRLYVQGARYTCYDQSRYLARHPTPARRALGFDWALYQVMLSDRARVRAYRRDIEATVRGKTVLEIGPGPTAVFTRVAAEAGAELVVSVEATAWVAREAGRRVRRFGSTVVVLNRHSDDLTAAEVGGRRHFDVLVVESYHAIAGQEGVVETLRRLRDNGFTFTEVISRGFSTLVAPSAAPESGPMTAVERWAMGWPADRRRADAAMGERASSLHGDMDRIADRRLAPAQVWQQADLESGAGARTAASLTFDIERAEDYAGLQFSNHFNFHRGVLDTGTTPTSWGTFFVPLPILAEAAGPGRPGSAAGPDRPGSAAGPDRPGSAVGPAVFTLATRLPDPGHSATVELRARLADGHSAPRRL